MKLYFFGVLMQTPPASVWVVRAKNEAENYQLDKPTHALIMAYNTHPARTIEALRKRMIYSGTPEYGIAMGAVLAGEAWIYEL